MSVCPVCSSPFKPRPGKVYCSRKCRSVAGNARQREVAIALRAAGLCRYCKSPVEPRENHRFILDALCAACRAKWRPKVRRNQAERAAAGACVRCGLARARGRLHCRLCLEYRRAWGRRAARKAGRGG